MPEKKKVKRPGSSVQARSIVPKGGRATPKGSHMPTTGRYTPPVPQEYKVSPRWVPVAMGILLIGGMLTIVTNYLGILPGGEADNKYLLGGLGMITLGFIVATRWR